MKNLQLYILIKKAFFS